VLREKPMEEKRLTNEPLATLIRLDWSGGEQSPTTQKTQNHNVLRADIAENPVLLANTP